MQKICINPRDRVCQTSERSAAICSVQSGSTSDSHDTLSRIDSTCSLSRCSFCDSFKHDSHHTSS